MLQMSKLRDTAEGQLGHGFNRPRKSDTPPDVGSNLRRLRHAQGYSLETLAKKSGVSRAMLGQIETGKSVPTITLIWKVATALGIPATALIEHSIDTNLKLIADGEAPTILASFGSYRIRSFSCPDFAQPFDFSQIQISAGHRETVSGYPWGTRATLLVTGGVIEIAISNEPAIRLTEGDTILFQADAGHSFFNSASTDATAFLIVAPAQNGVR